MRRLIFLGLALLLSLGIAQAGPNSNGAIIVHTNDAYNYSAGTACTTTLGLPADCASAITRSDKNFVTAGQRSTVWFLAAFVPTASPRVASVYFGTDVDDLNFDAGSNYAPCGPAGTQQVPDGGWPYDAGNSVGFGAPVIGNTFFRFYVFGLDNYDDVVDAPNPWWCSTINPTGGYAAFFDDSFPPNQDNITQFGCVRWYEPGSNSCPQVQANGSCCMPDGSCTLTAQIDCAAPGVWHGEWTSCEPNNCPQPVGACCATDGSCAITEETACVAPSVWHADWPSCEPNPCPQPPLPPPALESPADAATCIPVTGIVDWSDVVDATGYKVQIGVNCGAGVEHIVTASEFAFDLEPNTRYYWHVATRNVSGIFGAYSTCRTFTTEPILLAAPVLETPSDGATCQTTSGALNWSDVADAAGYRIQIDTSPSSGPEYDVASSDYAYSGLLPGTLYYWRVRTKNACGAYGQYSNSFSFTTDGPLAAPALQSPADGATDQAASLTLDWADVAGATAYTVQIGATCGTGAEVEVTASENSVSGLSPGTTYSWRVKTRNVCGTYGAYSTCFSFTTAPLPPATGACCNTATGACTITTEVACGFTWLGADVPCNTTTCPVPAATGACCNTATGACTITTEAACGFTWLGADVPCNVITCPPPTSDCIVKIVFPKGGQNLKVGTEYNIVWTSTGCGPFVMIELLLDGIVCHVIAPSTPNTGSYPWVAAQCDGDNMGYEVRVTDLATGSHAESLAPFTISVAPTTMLVTSPNGGENWQAGTNHDITWTSAYGGPTVKIELIHGNAVCAVLDPAAPNTGSYDWPVEGCRGTGGYRIRVTDVSFGIHDRSDHTFQIREDECHLRVTSPFDHEVWPRGTMHEIAWDVRGGCGDYVKIDLLRKVGSNYEFCMLISASTINDGSFDWTVDRCGSATARYRVCITDLTSGEVDVSGGYLRIPDPGQSPVSLALVTVPNPFRVNALVTFDLEYDSSVQAAIYNVAGQMVRSLVDQVLPGGRHDIAWDARDYTGVEVPSGIYYLKAVVDGEPVLKKILLIH